MRIKYVSATAAVVLLLGIAAAAQQQDRNTPPQPSEQQREQAPMSMEDMMKRCHEHCEMAMKSTDALANAIADAKASSDPATVRAALEQTDQPLADMREHMKMCMSMMMMMQKMNGGGAANP